MSITILMEIRRERRDKWRVDYLKALMEKRYRQDGIPALKEQTRKGSEDFRMSSIFLLERAYQEVAESNGRIKELLTARYDRWRDDDKG